jgi:hypothetical protein
MEKDLLPVAGKNNMGLLSKAMPSFKKRKRGDFTHIHIAEHFKETHIPEHIQYEVIVQEGKMVDAFLACLTQGHEVHV